MFLNLVDLLLNNLDSDNTPPTKDELRELRISLGINTKQIGKLIGVSKRTWERYESGEYEISYSSWIYLKMIANELPRVRVLVIGD